MSETIEYRTTSVNIKSPKKLKIAQILTRNSKHLYNKALYSIRQHFFNNNEYLSYNKNYKNLKISANEEGIIEYYQLPTNAAQQTIKNVDQSFKSFFSLLKKKNNGNYDAKINIPKYLDKDGYYKVIYTDIHFKVIGNQVRLALPKYLKQEYKELKQEQYLWFSLPKNVKDKKLKEVHILPGYKGKRISLAFVYQTIVSPKRLSSDNYLSIDLGLNNLVSMVNYSNGESILIDGKEIKSINRYYNKNISILKSMNKKLHNREYTLKMDKLTYKRNQKLKYIMHRISSYIIQYSKDNNISTIVIGKNK